MLCGTAIMNLFPDVLLGFFNADEAMLQIGIPAQRIISLCFPLAAIGIISGSIFQAFSRSIYSLQPFIASAVTRPFTAYSASSLLHVRFQHFCQEGSLIDIRQSSAELQIALAEGLVPDLQSVFP